MFVLVLESFGYFVQSVLMPPLLVHAGLSGKPQRISRSMIITKCNAAPVAECNCGQGLLASGAAEKSVLLCPEHCVRKRQKADCSYGEASL